MRARQLGRLNDLLPGGARLPVGDVFIDRPGKQVDILLYHPDLLPEGVEGEGADVLPVDQDASAGHVVEPRDQVAKGGFATARRPDQRDAFPGFDRQVDVRKHRGRVVRIVEPDLLEPDVPLDLPQLGRVWCILNVDRRINHFNEPFDPSHAALELLGKLDNAPHRGQQRRDIKQVGDEISGGDLSIGHEQPADHHDRQIHHPVIDAGGAVEPRHIAVLLFFDLEKRLISFVKLFLLQLLIGKGFDHAHAKEAVLDLCVDLACLVAGLFKRPAHPAVEIDGRKQHERDDREDNQGQREAVVREDRKRYHDFQPGDEKFFGAVVGKLGHIEQVACNPRHDLPNLVAIVKGVGQPLEMVKQIAAHVGFDPGSHHMPDALHKIVCGCIDDPQNQIEQPDPQDERDSQPDCTAGAAVGEKPHDQRQHQFADGGERRADQVDQHNCGVRFEIGGEAA